MKINYTAMKIGAAALGCAMMTGNICRGEEVAARSISSLAEVQQAMIPSTDRDWSFSLSAGWSSKYVTEGLDCLAAQRHLGGGSRHFLEGFYAWRLVCRRGFRQL